jgi:hypothetical protein
LGFKTAIFAPSALVLSRFQLHGPVHCISWRGRIGRANFGVVYRKTSPPGAADFPESSLRPDHALDFTRHSAPIFGGPPAERSGPKPSASRARVLGSKTPILVLIRVDLVRFRVPLPGSQPFSWRERNGRSDRFLGFLPQKSCRSTLKLMSRTTGRLNAREVYGFQRVLLRCLRAESETPRTSRLSGLNGITGSRDHMSPVSYSGNLFRHSVSDLLSDCAQRRGTATSVFNFPSGQWSSGCARGCSPYGLRAAGDEGQLRGATPKWMSVPCADQEIVRRRRPQ